MKNNNNWHIIYAKYGFEDKVQDKLKRLGVESFLPMTLGITQNKEEIWSSLFPGYLFVKIQTFLDFHKVSSLRATCSFVQFGKEYAKISQKEINKIRNKVGVMKLTETSAHIELLRIANKFKNEFEYLSGKDCKILDDQSVSITIASEHATKRVANLTYY